MKLISTHKKKDIVELLSSMKGCKNHFNFESDHEFYFVVSGRNVTIELDENDIFTSHIIKVTTHITHKENPFDVLMEIKSWVDTLEYCVKNLISKRYKTVINLEYV